MSKLTKTTKDLSIITYRGIKFILKRKRNIEKINFNYFKSWHAEQSYLILNIDFNNVIYYKINGIKYFNIKSHIYLNLKKIKTNKLEFEVFGFFQKQIFTVEIDKEIDFNSNQFQAKINQLHFEFIDEYKVIIKNNLINHNSPKVKLNITKTQINTVPFKLNFNTYKIENYL